jgi:hypothetical protein
MATGTHLGKEKDGTPAFERVSSTREELAELRMQSPRHVLAVIDSVAI